ncbi:hypothetical protein KJ735_01955, partial [Patescibacteria group bacterium]|nr:hypothetical protein [Patescibacteria group bacterium]
NMNKTTILIIILVVLGLANFWVYQSRNSIEDKVIENVFDPENATYMIEGDIITLLNGKAEKEIVPGSASKLEIMTWGQAVIGDLNSDEVNNATLILTYSAGGSGTFYYVVGALQDVQSKKAIGTNAILLGDRIAPQNIYINNGIIIVNYADRKLDEPMSTSPSIGITRNFEIQGTALVEVTLESAKREQACVISGGTIGTSLCCESAEDFPNNCLIGACGCAPANSHEVKTCDCGPDECFDGERCLSAKDTEL